MRPNEKYVVKADAQQSRHPNVLIVLKEFSQLVQSIIGATLNLRAPEMLDLLAMAGV